MAFQQRRSPPIAIPPATAAAAPFLPIDWSTPIAPLFPVALRTWQWSFPLPLIGQDRVYGAPGQVPSYAWPLPSRIVPAVSSCTWLNSVNLNLLGQDRVYGAPGQVPSYPWPGPVLRPAPAYSWQTPLNPNLIGQDRIYGAPGQAPDYDWPLPIRGPAVVAAGTFVNLLTTTLATSAAVPFAVTDWPTPVTTAYPLSGRTWLNPINLNLLGQDQLFGAPGQVPAYDWPLPKTTLFPVALRTWLLGLNTTTPVPSTTQPFTPVEWRNPTPPPYPIALLTWLDPTKVWLIGLDQFYGDPGQVPSYDWPMPKGPVYPVGLRTWVGGLNTTTLVPGPPSVGGPKIIMVNGRLAIRIHRDLYEFIT